MTEPAQQGLPQHGDMDAFEGDPPRRGAMQREIDAGREAELSKDDSRFAAKHGLIEG